VWPSSIPVKSGFLILPGARQSPGSFPPACTSDTRGVGRRYARGQPAGSEQRIRVGELTSLDGWANVGDAFGQDPQDVAAQGGEVAGVVGAQELGDG